MTSGGESLRAQASSSYESREIREPLAAAATAGVAPHKVLTFTAVHAWSLSDGDDLGGGLRASLSQRIVGRARAVGWREERGGGCFLLGPPRDTQKAKGKDKFASVRKGFHHFTLLRDPHKGVELRALDCLV